MAWDSAKVSALGSIGGAVATAIGAAFVWWQISATTSTLYSSNSYTVQKDIIEAADRLLEARDQVRNQADTSKSALLIANQARLAIKFDSLMEAVTGLKANDGISNNTWAHILWLMCPAFNKYQYKIDDVTLDSTRDACANNTELWRVKPK